METVEVLKTTKRLIESVWAFDTLCYAAEKGILEQLSEPRTLSRISKSSKVPSALAEDILDVLVALNLVRREGDTFVADEGLLPLTIPPFNTSFLATLRVNYFRSRHFVDGARKPTIALEWDFTEPEILNAQGLFSATMLDPLFRESIPKLGNLESQLQAPSARFLDVGSGVGAISIAACRLYPNLHVVGLEPQDAPLAEARRNITEAGLDGQIEFRQQLIQDMKDKDTFDLAYFPQTFMPDNVVKRGLKNIRRALRPGGWVLVEISCLPGTEFEAALSRLHVTLLGGGARLPSQVEAMMSDAGFISVRTFASPLLATLRCVAGQRPI